MKSDHWLLDQIDERGVWILNNFGCFVILYYIVYSKYLLDVPIFLLEIKLNRILLLKNAYTRSQFLLLLLVYLMFTKKNPDLIMRQFLLS